MRKREAGSPIAPRLLTKEQAAHYCGLSPSGLDAWVRAGIVPGPIAGTKRYDLRAIDAALDRHSGIKAEAASIPEDPLEKWLRESGHSGR